MRIHGIWLAALVALVMGGSAREGRTMLVIGHRGVPAEAPQNTLAGLRRAIALGLDYVELDLRTTADGAIVDSHNSTVDGHTDGKGPISQMSLAELRKLDAGSWYGRQFRGERVPLFAEELAVAKGRIKFYLDMKDVDPLAVVRLLAQFDMVEDAVCYTGVADLERMQAVDPRVRAMPHLARAQDMPALAARVHPYCVERGAGPLDTEAIAAAHAQGAKYFLDIQGEGDNEANILACLKAGVDAVQTDHPALVLTVLRKAGIKRPAPGPAPEAPPVPGRRHDPQRVKIIAHRGANRHAPQNTLPASREAIALGLDYIELDLRTTADGLLVDIHNRTVDQTTNGRGEVKALRYRELRALDAGSWFSPAFKGTHLPLLGEVLALAKDRIGIYLDWKEAEPEPVVRLLQAFGMTQQVLVHEDEETCRQVRALDPSIPLMPGANSVEEVRRLAEGLHPYAVEVRWRYFSEEAVQVCHQAGMLCATSLAAAGEDTEQAMRRAVAAGLDMIETDDPELLLRVLRAMSRE